ncbi:alpha-ketoglutarate-dependent dioxygenase AlkB [Janthinobacterium lividum]|nr:alpha-ketoglutarate-dependent dioxygenase AlkB [Janthinobacterium lividum]
MELLSEPDDAGAKQRESTVLAVGLDHHTFLNSLVEDWIFPDAEGWLRAGIDCIERPASSDLQVVVVWFDIAKLPQAEVLVWRDSSWVPEALSRLSAADKILRWPGPLPLFAAKYFSVESNEFRSHLLGMVRRFSDMEIPPQPVEVKAVRKVEEYPPCGHASRISPPFNWDHLRGAAAMALATVPTIGPWLQVLCESLSAGKRSGATKLTEAPWLHSAIWSEDCMQSAPPLWGALVAEMSRPNLYDDWTAQQILENVCSRARKLGEDEILVDRLMDATVLLLQDRGTIQDLGIHENVVALVLQLMLLRPDPERYMSWKDDWRAIPPGAWWTGAMLSGYVAGYSRLPASLRGENMVRRFLSLRTWALAKPNGLDFWGKWSKEKVSWKPIDEYAQINIGKEILLSRKMSQRGLWYEQNFLDPEVLADATALASDVCPHLLRQTLTLESGVFKYAGKGKIKVAAKQSTLSVEGSIEISVPAGAVTSKLDIDGFRSWLTVASIPYRLPRPVPQQRHDEKSDEAYSQSSFLAMDSASIDSPLNSPKKSSVPVLDPPSGLAIIPSFLERDEESGLLEVIDSNPWDDSMSRRVQHYGWRYDYKARRVDPNAYMGPLPSWAQVIAQRLLDEGLVPELPDQVIVNEYKRSQGISKHIDCPACFRGPVVTISLRETWEMVFSRKFKGEEQKYRVMLPRCSAAILAGEARSKWSHEIAKKRADDGVARERRVSVTFRKVSI